MSIFWQFNSLKAAVIKRLSSNMADLLRPKGDSGVTNPLNTPTHTKLDSTSCSSQASNTSHTSNTKKANATTTHWNTKQLLLILDLVLVFDVIWVQ